jgi:hypothetical protein
MPVLTNPKRLLPGKFTTTNLVKRIATMEGGNVNIMRDIWRGVDPWDFFFYLSMRTDVPSYV